MPETIYIASRTRHAARWRRLRDAGAPVVSGWLDAASDLMGVELSALWTRIGEEIGTLARQGGALVAYLDEGDVLDARGVLVEVGMALAAGVWVVVDCPESCRNLLGDWTAHHMVDFKPGMLAALEAARGLAPWASSAPPVTGGSGNPRAWRVAQPLHASSWVEVVAAVGSVDLVVVHGACGTGKSALLSAIDAARPGALICDMPETGMDLCSLRLHLSKVLEGAGPARLVAIASHSLYVLREVELAQRSTCWIGLEKLNSGGVFVRMGDDVAATGDIVALDEELKQSDRWMVLHLALAAQYHGGVRP